MNPTGCNIAVKCCRRTLRRVSGIQRIERKLTTCEESGVVTYCILTNGSPSVSVQCFEWQLPK